MFSLSCLMRQEKPSKPSQEEKLPGYYPIYCDLWPGRAVTTSDPLFDLTRAWGRLSRLQQKHPPRSVWTVRLGILPTRMDAGFEPGVLGETRFVDDHTHTACIYLSPYLTDEGADHVLPHEYAHVLTGPGHGHDTPWEKAARRVGAPPDVGVMSHVVALPRGLSQEFSQMLTMRPGWDGGVALPVENLTIARAIAFIKVTLVHGMDIPVVQPRPDGGVDVDWTDGYGDSFHFDVVPDKGINCNATLAKDDGGVKQLSYSDIIRQQSLVQFGKLLKELEWHKEDTP